MRFEEYSESLREAQAHFILKAKNFLPYNDSEMGEMSAEERDRIIEWYSEDYLKYTEDLPTTLRNTYLIGYY
jgi:hypothetical protein